MPAAQISLKRDGKVVNWVRMRGAPNFPLRNFGTVLEGETTSTGRREENMGHRGSELNAPSDPIEILEEWCQKVAQLMPEFRLGPEFNPSDRNVVFPMEVFLSNELVGRGRSNDFTKAKRAASRRALANLNHIANILAWEAEENEALAIEGSHGLTGTPINLTEASSTTSTTSPSSLGGVAVCNTPYAFISNNDNPTKEKEDSIDAGKMGDEETRLLQEKVRFITVDNTGNTDMKKKAVAQEKEYPDPSVSKPSSQGLSDPHERIRQTSTLQYAMARMPLVPASPQPRDADVAMKTPGADPSMVGRSPAQLPDIYGVLNKAAADTVAPLTAIATSVSEQPSSSSSSSQSHLPSVAQHSAPFYALPLAPIPTPPPPYDNCSQRPPMLSHPVACPLPPESLKQPFGEQRAHGDARGDAHARSHSHPLSPQSTQISSTPSLPLPPFLAPTSTSTHPGYTLGLASDAHTRNTMDTGNLAGAVHDSQPYPAGVYAVDPMRAMALHPHHHTTAYATHPSSTQTFAPFLPPPLSSARHMLNKESEPSQVYLPTKIFSAGGGAQQIVPPFYTVADAAIRPGNIDLNAMGSAAAAAAGGGGGGGGGGGAPFAMGAPGSHGRDGHMEDGRGEKASLAMKSDKVYRESLGPANYGGHSYSPSAGGGGYETGAVASASASNLGGSGGSMDMVSESLMDHLKEQTRAVPDPAQSTNPKADLSNWCGQVGLPQPVYRSDRIGPDHRPYYTVKVFIKNFAAGKGEGARKTAGEVDAAADTLRNLNLWTQCLRLEGDKFFRVNSFLCLHGFDADRMQPISIDEKRLLAMSSDFADSVDSRLLQQLVCHANAFANTAGGIIVLGVSQENEIHGIRLTRAMVHQLVIQFNSQLKEWKPIPHRECFTWKVWPVFTKEEIDTGVMFDVMDSIFDNRDSKGMVWPPEQPIVLGLFVAKSQFDTHELSIMQLLEDPPQDINRYAYVRDKDNIRLLSNERLGGLQ